MTTTRRSALSLVGTVAVTTVLTACSGSGSSSPTPTSPATGSSPTSGGPLSSVPTGFAPGTGSGAEDDVFPRVVNHLRGSTTITAAPTRVVVIAPGLLAAVLARGTVPVGAAAAGAAPGPEDRARAVDAPAGPLGAVTNLAGTIRPSLQAVTDLRPDLVLMSADAQDANSLYREMSEVAATVAVQGTDRSWKQDLLLVADALGRTQSAQTWLETYHADARAASQPPGSPTVSLLSLVNGHLHVFGPASLAGSVLADMGVARPGPQAFTDTASQELTPTDLGQTDADWIFYAVRGGRANELTGMQGWSSLGAVSANQAVQVQEDPFFLNPGPTAARPPLARSRRASPAGRRRGRPGARRALGPRRRRGHPPS